MKEAAVLVVRRHHLKQGGSPAKAGAQNRHPIWIPAERSYLGIEYRVVDSLRWLASHGFSNVSSFEYLLLNPL